MERASVLNWTPGSDSWDVGKGKKEPLVVDWHAGRQRRTRPDVPLAHCRLGATTRSVASPTR